MAPDSHFLQQLIGAPGRLSVCMIVKNEATDLGRCLKSIAPAADQLVVVDTGSTDATVAIAHSFGAVVVHEPWQNDFSLARNRSIKEASGQWILWLDADDEVPEGSLAQLAQLKKEPANRAYAFLVRNEKPGNTGSEFVQVRLFPNHPAIKFERRIHEQVMPSVAALGLEAHAVNVEIIHHGYSDPQTTLRKARRNVTLLLEDFDEGAPDAVMGLEIAESYTILQQPEQAIEWYRRVSLMDPRGEQMPQITSQALYGIGSMLVSIERPLEAQDPLEQSLALTPGRADALYSLAVVFDTTGRSAQAIKLLTQILVAKDRQAMLVGVDFREARIRAFLRLERILREQGRPSEAWDAARLMLELAPQRPEIHNAVGAMYCREGKIMEALKTFEKSLELRTDGNVFAFIGLCMVYTRAGRPEIAADTMKIMAKLFVDRPAYWAFYTMIHRVNQDYELPVTVDRAVVEKERMALISMYDFSGRTGTGTWTGAG